MVSSGGYNLREARRKEKGKWDEAGGRAYMGGLGWVGYSISRKSNQLSVTWEVRREASRSSSSLSSLIHQSPSHRAWFSPILRAVAGKARVSAGPAGSQLGPGAAVDPARTSMAEAVGTARPLTPGKVGTLCAIRRGDEGVGGAFRQPKRWCEQHQAALAQKPGTQPRRLKGSVRLFPGKQTLSCRSACGSFMREHSWDPHTWEGKEGKDKELRRERSQAVILPRTLAHPVGRSADRMLLQLSWSGGWRAGPKGRNLSAGVGHPGKGCDLRHSGSLQLRQFQSGKRLRAVYCHHSEDQGEEALCFQRRLGAVPLSVITLGWDRNIVAALKFQSSCAVGRT